MDPFQQQPPPVCELASTLAATNQVVNATTGINIATSDHHSRSCWQRYIRRVCHRRQQQRLSTLRLIGRTSAILPLGRPWDVVQWLPQSPPSASREPSRNPEQLHPHRRLGRRPPACRPPRYKTTRTSQVGPTTQHMRIGSV